METFFPQSDRLKFALKINTIIASPSFSSWLEGESLDISKMLYSQSGKAKVNIFSIAHLNDSQRMFFVTILLNQILAWMRRQEGTTSLKALLYMDEIFGYFPPQANPPSKQPMLTLLKQARSFGIGVILSTQNPVDIDYKGLSNIGTWFIGRLQTKQDIEKVRDKVDVLIVAMHWGVEYTHNPTEYEKDMASYLASLGVDLIIGTHPHVIQPVTWIDNTLVIYSLGNFLSAQYQNQSTCTNYKCTTGLMTSLKIEKDVKGKEKSIKITNVENELIYNYYNQSTWRGFKVIPFSNPEIKTYLPSYKSVYNTYKEVVQRLDSNMYVKETVE